MMFNPPFFTPPFHRRFPTPYYNPPIPTTEDTPQQESQHYSTSDQNNTLETSKNTENHTSQKRDFKNENPQIFHIAGITLYFDDILIICLLFFLYSEGVKDEMLFISLILLLLS